MPMCSVGRHILARCPTFSTASLMSLAERVVVYLGQHADAGLV